MNDYHRIPEGILGEETVEKTNTELFLSLVGQYFPEAIKDGEVDFTALKEEMGEFPQVSSEHYEFTWAGKQAAKKEAQADLFGRTLKYKPQDSLNPDTTENLYIEGDNLEALKLLRRNYHGKIKVIYIDPPYNTGNDSFIYNDNRKSSVQEIGELSKDITDGVKLQKNLKDSAQFHTNWLNMMFPLLKISKEILSDDGVIFISIGQDEAYNLIKICNEIFGNYNKVGVVSRLMKSGGNKGQYFSPNIEYVLVYAKNIYELGYFREPLSEDIIKTYNHQESNGERKGEMFTIKGLCQPGLGIRPNQRYWIQAPDGSYLIPKGVSFPSNVSEGEKILPTDEDTCWKWTYDRYKEEKKKGNIYFHKSTSATALVDESGNVAKWNVFNKIWLSDREAEGRVPVDLITKWENRISSAELKKMDIPFDFAKPTELIEYLINLVDKNDNAVILDFFSGSATTAHSVMALNANDNKNRKFIMVQIPELCDEKSEAFKSGYKNICEIGKERIRRAAKKIHKDNPDAQFDDGFKVFEVSDTNIKWNTVDDNEVLTLADMDNSISDKDRIDFNKGYTDIDVVYEVMLRQFDIPLSTPIEKLSSVSDRTYIFADAVVVCLEPDIDEQLIERLAAIEPTPAKFVLRDSAFNDDIELKDVSFRRLSALIANHQTEEERKSKYNNYTVEFI